MIEDLRIRGLSQDTIDTYVGAVARFARHFGRPPAELGKEHVRAFQVHLVEERHVATGTLNVYTSALRFLYTVTLERDYDIRTIPYARTPKRLPSVLTQEEVLRLLDGITNLKHRALATTLYAAGLRASEVACLRVVDIDSRRMLIHVREGKGRRDRLVPLAEALLELLRQYYRRYRPEPWLFLGQDKKRHINSRSVHRVLGGDVRPIDEYATAGRRREPRDQVEDRALARSARPHQCPEGSGRELEGDVVDGGDGGLSVTEGLGDVAELDHGGGSIAVRGAVRRCAAQESSGSSSWRRCRRQWVWKLGCAGILRWRIEGIPNERAALRPRRLLGVSADREQRVRVAFDREIESPRTADTTLPDCPGLVVLLGAQ
jgi:integrase/recombinase XerD